MTSNKKMRPIAITVICSLVYFVSYFSRKDFAAAMVGMIEAGVIDKSMGGFIGMGMFICYGLGQLVSGFLGDKMKPRDLILFGLILTAVANAFMPVMPKSWLMIPLWSINGFAQAMLWPPIVRLLADNLDHERFVRANLAVTVSAHLATVLLYLYVPLCIEYFDWRTVFATASVMALAAVGVFFVAMLLITAGADRPSRVNKGRKDERPLTVGSLKMLATAGIFTVLVAIVAMGFLRDGIESWLPTLYSEVFGVDASTSVLVSVALPVSSALSITIITAVHKTRLFGNEVLGSSVLFIASVALCGILAVVIEIDSGFARVLSLVLAALICALMHAVNFLLISCLPGRFSRVGRAATTSGVCNACTYIGAAISMYGIAALAENQGWSVTVISWIIISAVGVVFTLASLSRFRRFISRAECETVE